MTMIVRERQLQSSRWNHMKKKTGEETAMTLRGREDVRADVFAGDVLVYEYIYQVYQENNQFIISFIYPLWEILSVTVSYRFI